MGTEDIFASSQALQDLSGSCPSAIPSLRSCSAEAEVDSTTEEEDTPDRKLARSLWAALIKRVFEVDPLICLHCDKEMHIIALIEKRGAG